MKTTAIIVAAGSGTRAKTREPKQYQSLNGKFILDWTLEVFEKSQLIDQIIVVIRPEDHELYAKLELPKHARTPIQAISGGKMRGDSVQAGLAKSDSEFVAIHDAARPLLPQSDLDAVIKAAHKTGAAFLAAPATDAMWRFTNGELSAVDRSDVWRALTPQVFERTKIIDAYARSEKQYSDDVAVLQSLGCHSQPVIGSAMNLKITHPSDFEIAEKLLKG